MQNYFLLREIFGYDHQLIILLKFYENVDLILIDEESELSIIECYGLLSEK